MGTCDDYPPISDWQGEQPQGFSVALVEQFAADYRFQPSWVLFRWPEMVQDLEAGKFDMSASGITLRPERSVVGRFTVPIIRNSAVLLLRRPAWAPPGATSSRPTRESALAELRAMDRPELRVVVNRGGHLERVARSLFHQAQVQAIPDNAAAREALASGEADAAVTNTLEASHWAQGLTGLELLGPLTRDVVAIYVRADQPQLASQLSTWLLRKEQSGELAALRARYLGPGNTEPTAFPVQALLAATAERLALMPLVAAAKQREGRPVEDAAQEARVLAAFRAEVRSAAAARDRAPPPEEALDAFFRAQIEAAKGVQQRAPVSASAPVFSLETQLRPAVARISSRMADLVTRLPEGLDEATVLEQARDWLGDSGLEPSELERIARTLPALGAWQGDEASSTHGPR